MAQFSIQDKNVQRLLAGFVLFLILTSPQVAGEQTRAFAGWLGDALSQIMVFLDGLFGTTQS